MTQTEALHRLFQANGNVLTLGQILDAWREIGSNETGRISDLRVKLKLEGYTITCEKKPKRPTENIYRIVPYEQISEPMPKLESTPADVQMDIPSAPNFEDKQAVFGFR